LNEFVYDRFNDGLLRGVNGLSVATIIPLQGPCQAFLGYRGRFSKKPDFVEADQCDLDRPVPFAKIFLFLRIIRLRPTQITSIFPKSRSIQRGVRDRYERGAGMRWPWRVLATAPEADGEIVWS
jgi:hypothetical protein